jgi:hypothetical protein
VELLQGHRFLIREGELRAKKSFGERFFLFNDLLVCCKLEKKWGEKEDSSSPSTARYKYISKISIDANCKVEDPKDPKSKLPSWRDLIVLELTFLC